MTDPTEAIDAAAFANLVEMTGGEMDFVDELVDTYLDDGAQLVEQLRDAAGRGDAAALVRPVHSLKSSSVSVGALRLGEQCRTLEEAARNGSVPHREEWVAAIASGFDDARRELLAERERRASGYSSADEIAKLAKLLEEGTISAEEFETLKQRALA